MKEIAVISVALMRESDARTIASLGSGLELMYRAGKALYLAVPPDRWAGRVSILVGSGNNGGDGFALAGILADKGITETVYQMSSKVSPDSEHFRELARTKNVALRRLADADKPLHDDDAAFDITISPSEMKRALLASDVIVDCLLGTGFHGTLEGAIRELVLAINESSAYVISADINSGLNGTTGLASLAVESSLTVSIGFFKDGMLRADAPRYIKRLVNADIGIELARTENRLLAPEDYDRALTRAREQGTSIECASCGDVDSFSSNGTTTYRQPSWVSLDPIQVV